MERQRSDTKVTEEKLTVGLLIRIVALTVLACIGFLGLWAFMFLLSLPLMNLELSVILSMLTSAITIFALITMIPSKRRNLIPSKRQTVGLYIAWAIVFVFTLPLIKIDPLLFLGYLPTLMAVTFIMICDVLRRRKGKEMAQK